MSELELSISMLFCNDPTLSLPSVPNKEESIEEMEDSSSKLSFSLADSTDDVASAELQKGRIPSGKSTNPLLLLLLSSRRTMVLSW
jgi:hypothetical protein